MSGDGGGKNEVDIEVEGDGDGGDLTHPTGSTLAGEEGKGSEERMREIRLWG